jgi:hypothetical protein
VTQITRVGFIARRIIDGGGVGHVVAAFERSAYVDIGSQLVCLGSESLEMGPLMAICAEFEPVQRGSKITFANGAARIWYPPRPIGWCGESLMQGIAALPGLSQRLIPERGLSTFILESDARKSEDAISAAAAGPIDGFERWLAEAFAAGSQSGPVEIGALVGLGPGLTPSGDDFIGGAMVALQALERADLAAQLYSVALSSEDIGPISAAHLVAAQEGAASAPLHNLTNDLICGRVANLPVRMTGLSRMGHSSGWDAFAGAMVVFRVAVRSFQSRSAQSQAA